MINKGDKIINMNKNKNLWNKISNLLDQLTQFSDNFLTKLNVLNVTTKEKLLL